MMRDEDLLVSFLQVKSVEFHSKETDRILSMTTKDGIRLVILLNRMEISFVIC